MAMGPLAYRVSEPRHGGVLLVGDAAGFYDPFTGEGNYTALRSAELLVDVAHAALSRGDVSARALRAYSRARRALRDKEWITRALQFIIARRRLSNWVAHRLAQRSRVARSADGRDRRFRPTARAAALGPRERAAVDHSLTGRSSKPRGPRQAGSSP
jgi:flavin-dependent dehydrogenase